MRATLNIADVNLSMASPYPLDLGHLPPAYGPFRGLAARSPRTLDVAIAVEQGSATLPPSCRVLFDTGDSWALYADGDAYYLSLDPRGDPGEGLWTARIARDLAHATVYCTERTVRSTDRGIALANPVTYPLDQILLMLLLARRDGLLVHAAGVSVGGRGFLFAGRSGAGKSTLCRHLTGQDGLEILSDDRMALRRTDGAVAAYGTPWPGDQGAALNQRVPLAGLLFLRHASADEVVELTRRDALARLLPVASIPWYDAESVAPALAFCEKLLARVPAYELRFAPGPRVARLVAELA